MHQPDKRDHSDTSLSSLDTILLQNAVVSWSNDIIIFLRHANKSLLYRDHKVYAIVKGWVSRSGCW